VPPPPEEPPPQEETLRITGVQFINLAGAVVATMQSPDQLVTFKASNAVHRVRLTFNRNIDTATIRTGGVNEDPKASSLLVSASWSTRPLKATFGGVIFDTPASAIYEIRPDPRMFSPGDYALTLFGTPDPANLRPIVKATDGDVLDGEPVAFPSGDAAAGGDFIIKFHVD
jgi:hypothetical protein